MMTLVLTNLLASSGWSAKTINYEIIKGNEIWRIALVLIVVLAAMAAGRIAQFTIKNYCLRRNKKSGATLLTIFLNCLAKPISVAIFSLGFYLCKFCLVFEDKTATPANEGISLAIETGWIQIAKTLVAIAVTYALYSLVDLVEYYLERWTGKTETKLDDMLVPVVRKSLRVTISIIAAIYIIDNILGQDVRSILLGAGVGGIAIALAAKDTIANFFGSVTIFADRPFQIDELIKIGDCTGTVEDVGFRSTRIRTKQGHLVDVPNSVIANSNVDNFGSRSFNRRTSNIHIHSALYH